MIPVVSTETMKKMDAETIKNGVDGKELMMRAAKGIFAAHVFRGNTAIVCGTGNNAGDGFVLALLLADAGLECEIFLLKEDFSPDGRFYFEKCKEKRIPYFILTREVCFQKYAQIVDCMFGTGFHGEMDAFVQDVIEKINRSGAFIISADINSGLNGNNGLGQSCINSDLTVSIGSFKYGHFLGDSKDHIKKAVNVDIGIPVDGHFSRLLEIKDCRSVLEERKHSSHKGIYGYVTILGGCTEYSGAVKLANLSCSALRAGCGVSRLAVPESVISSVSPYLLESTLMPMPDVDGKMVFDNDTLEKMCQNQSAVAVGMGWGKSQEYEKILTFLLNRPNLRLIIDADGLNTLSEMDFNLFKNAKAKVVLTPHLKEFERLSGIPVSEIQKDPVTASERFAGTYHCVLLLKGACTIVTNGEMTYLVDRGCPGMATAGSGDVLSGVILGLLGSHEATPLSVACGAYIAGLAGELAESKINPVCMIASDTVSQISNAVSEILKKFKISEKKEKTSCILEKNMVE